VGGWTTIGWIVLEEAKLKLQFERSQKGRSNKDQERAKYEEDSDEGGKKGRGQD
jgi:hypothetical protein